MGGGLSLSISMEKMKTAALLFGLICALSLGILAMAGSAGTETGEFCPTCPDWTNLDGWLAQRDAYERAQMNEQNSQQGAGVAGQPPAIVPQKAAESYVRPDLITMPERLDEKGVILDVRSEEDYRSGHISGARNIYWKSLQNKDILDISLLEKALSEAGIDERQRIIICGSSDDEGGPFLFWALSYLGHGNISLLDGGIEAAEEAGADALSLINTLTGMAIDVESRKPKLANIVGGLSGPAIKPIALYMVYQVARAVKIPVIGMGGIMNHSDAVEFLMVGARAVEVGTANFVNPRVTLEVIDGIRTYCTENGIRKISEIVGSLKTEPVCSRE